MGLYLNPGNEEFRNAAIHSKIYVDKTEMIKFTNSQLFGEHKNICVSRPRRFGKSMAANMLVAYYSKGCDSKELFENFKIADDSSFKEHLNKYNVIHLNIQQFLGRTETIHEMLELLSRKVTRELKREFADVTYYEEDLVSVIEEIYAQTHSFFVFIIDEWDCIFRVKGEDTEAQKLYLNFLRDLLKNQPYCILAYMTGILPIKKYGEHSALNMFDEYSMTNQRELAEFTGFTEQEVQELCPQYDMSYDKMKQWYDGYDLKGIQIYNLSFYQLLPLFKLTNLILYLLIGQAGSSAVCIHLVDPVFENRYQRMVFVHSFLTFKFKVFVYPISYARKSRSLAYRYAWRTVEQF